MAKQNELPGYERVKIPELDTKSGKYVKLRDQHADLTRRLKVAKDELTESMHKYESGVDEAGEQIMIGGKPVELEKLKNGDPIYVWHDGDEPLVTTLESSEKLKVRPLSDENDPGAALG